ncbi:uncharacterized protein LOC125387223 [Bombus terrestris]|uniref:Uncharacterized protein LOC125387223 n=1 Tax=Bombus terrestris TaxID=30195 RepID=A0A9C6WCC7_BOMTE|nr:uncharacterized protein LOC125387223 [Bombus terrestris]
MSPRTQVSRSSKIQGPSPREATFLSTLSQTSAPQLGGRRHSVVTIERVSPTLFGRNRRESIARFPFGVVTRILPSRRDPESRMSAPPSGRGSTHNLQLDIMDDIADLKARKVRLRMYRTSTEQVYEMQPLEGNSSVQRYTEQPKQRFFEMPTLSVSPTSSLRKRVSELPRAARTPVFGAAGMVCSNRDLISILSSVGSSATEMSKKPEDLATASSSLRFDELKVVKAMKKMFGKKSPNSEVVWDNTSGTKVDAQVFGSAIEKILTAQKGNDTEIPRASGSSGKPSVSSNKPMSGEVTNLFWNSKNQKQTEFSEPSLCSSLKDLFKK